MKNKTRIIITLAVIIVCAALLLAAGLMYRRYWAERRSRPHIGEGSTFRVHFFDVGEGDAALVECDGHYMLIDGGTAGYSRFLYAWFEEHNIEVLDAVICTHAHADHVGGLAGALNYAKVGTAYAPVATHDSRAFNSFVKYLDAQGVAITIPTPGDAFRLGAAEVTFLGPVDMTLAEEDENNASIVLRVVYGNTSFLFTGDAEAAEERSIVDSGARLRSTLLKVGHHGSYSSSSAEFLNAVRPQYEVISVGKGNDYGHPHTSALKRLGKYCKAIYRTDEQGEIICYSDGHDLSFSTER